MEIQLRRGALMATAETLGGELVSLRGDREYIWGGDPAYWTGRNPVLFPIVGSLKNETVRIDGRDYHMGRHGFARRSEFTPVDQGADYVVLQLRESPETLAQYPCPFSLQVRHQLLDGGFSTTFTVENTGAASMPFCIGAHTAFRCPLEDGRSFQDYQLVFDEPEDADSLLLTPEGILRNGQTERFLSGGRTLPLDYDVFARLDTLIFQGLRSKGVTLADPQSGRGLHLSYEGFPMIAFWTKPGAPFLCLEPWHGCAAFDDESGDFTDKPYCVTLAPGEIKTLTYQVTLLPAEAASRPVEE